MQTILIKTLSFFFILSFGALLRKAGIITREVRDALTKIVIYCTLPAAILIGYKNSDLQLKYLLIILAGLGLNLLTILIGYIMTRNKDKKDRVTACLSFTGYNIGSFSLPLTQQFLPLSLHPIICLFDFGNAIMTLGGSDAVVAALFSGQMENKLRAFLKKAFGSPSLIMEFLMTILALSHIKLPEIVYSITEPAASANFFVSVVLIGSMLELKPEQFRTVKNFLLIRLVFTLVMAYFLWLILPFGRAIRLTVILASFSPISMMSAIYTERNGGDSSVASITYSCYVFISVALMMSIIYILSM